MTAQPCRRALVRRCTEHARSAHQHAGSSACPGEGVQPAVLQLEASGAAQAVAGGMGGRIHILAVARGAWRGRIHDCEFQLWGSLRRVPHGRNGGCPPSPPTG